jgi:hypothetical protein
MIIFKHGIEMHSGTVIRKAFAVVLIGLFVGCSGRSSKLYLREIEIDSLKDSTRSENSIWTYLNSRTLGHFTRCKDSWGYDEIFYPAFLRGVPGYLVLGYSTHSRLDSAPKIGFSWVANDSIFAFVGDSIRQKGFENIAFSSRRESFDTLAMRLAALTRTPYEDRNPFSFGGRTLVLMDDSSLSIDIRGHHFVQ